MTDDPLGKVERLKRANPKRPFDPKGGRLPPGQYLTEKFLVLHYGSVPGFDPQTWDLQVWGLVEHPIPAALINCGKLGLRATPLVCSRRITKVAFHFFFAPCHPRSIRFDGHCRKGGK